MSLLLFNWWGYRFFTAYLQNKADYKLQSVIDANNYDESQLIELRVALNMPYQNNQSEFERYYGEVEVNGKIYTYVKRKIEDGYLVLKCLPNHEKQAIQNANNILFSINNGLDQNDSRDHSPLNNFVKSFLPDFDDHVAGFRLTLPIAMINQAHPNQISNLLSPMLSVDGQPPELL